MLLKEISLGVVKAGQDNHKWMVCVLGLMVNTYDGEQKFTVFQVIYYILLF